MSLKALANQEFERLKIATSHATNMQQGMRQHATSHATPQEKFSTDSPRAVARSVARFVGSVASNFRDRSKERSISKLDYEILVNWFNSATNLPMEPFDLKHAVKITDPTKFYRSLQRDIQKGLSGDRCLFGALQDDLNCLRRVVEERGLQQPCNSYATDYATLDRIAV